MGITKDEAFRILELHRGASADEVRASYKRLALKWHPDKHNNSSDATKKFQEISSAYKRLTSEDSDDEVYLSRADMFDLFAHIFFHRNGMYGCHRHAFESDDDSYFSDEDDEEDMEDDLLHNIATRLRSKYDRSKPSTNTKSNGKPAHNLSEAEANKNAEELIKEEERDRKKAEKRRQKKKRNKEKKKQKEKDKKDQTSEKENKQDNNKGPTIGSDSTRLKETQNTHNRPTQNGKLTKTTDSSGAASGLKEHRNTNDSTKKARTKASKRSQVNGETDSSSDEPDWDTSSAFFAHAAGRNPPTNPPIVTTKSSNLSKVPIPITAIPDETKNTNKPQTPSDDTTQQMDPLVLQSRQIAVRGNEMANMGNYQAAIELFSQAVKLDARDFRFFGNRSYCFDRLGQFEKALQDADVAISLAPDWPKGYFRRGRALAGLKLYADAESAFAQVLKLDKHCQDAMFELARVRVQQLEEMGFPTNQSEAAIHSYGTVQAALEALLAGKVNCPTAEEIYVSDGEEDQHKISQKQRPIQNTNSTSPAQNDCKSVWVGNVNSEEVTERHLQQLFSRCGQIETIKILPKKYCAFINYFNPNAASKAIESFQGYEMGGQKFLLRFPNNNTTSTLQPTVQPSAESHSRPKISGPVNGDECYFWRTTGCAFAEKCRNRHVPGNKGCDLKKFEAKYGSKM